MVLPVVFSCCLVVGWTRSVGGRHAVFTRFRSLTLIRPSLLPHCQCDVVLQVCGFCSFWRVRMFGLSVVVFFLSFLSASARVPLLRLRSPLPLARLMAARLALLLLTSFRAPLPLGAVPGNPSPCVCRPFRTRPRRAFVSTFLLCGCSLAGCLVAGALAGLRLLRASHLSLAGSPPVSTPCFSVAFGRPGWAWASRLRPVLTPPSFTPHTLTYRNLFAFRGCTGLLERKRADSRTSGQLQR